MGSGLGVIFNMYIFVVISFNKEFFVWVISLFSSKYNGVFGYFFFSEDILVMYKYMCVFVL